MVRVVLALLALGVDVPACADETPAPTPNECGARWDGYVLAPSGSHDCGSCGASIETYEACEKAAASGAAALGIGGLAERENWSGPPGCHIQDRFQWNDNRAGGSHEGHAPVCYDLKHPGVYWGSDDYVGSNVAPPPVAEPFAFEQSCAAAHEGVCREKDYPEAGMNVDEDCCALEESAKCEEGYKYSRGSKCWEGDGCKAYKTCCTKCDDPNVDCENKNDKWGQDAGSCHEGDGDIVGIIIAVIIGVVACGAIGGSVTRCSVLWPTIFERFLPGNQSSPSCSVGMLRALQPQAGARQHGPPRPGQHARPSALRVRDLRARCHGDGGRPGHLRGASRGGGRPGHLRGASRGPPGRPPRDVPQKLNPYRCIPPP